MMAAFVVGVGGSDLSAEEFEMRGEWAGIALLAILYPAAWGASIGGRPLL